VEPPLPLHRWRLSGELTELRTDDLSFTAGETVELLARHDLPVSAAHASELHARTEGWPAGLRFATLANPAEASELSGEDQVIADYLAEEVLAAQPPEIQDTLLATSILQRVSGGLVDALTGRTDGEQILAELDRTNAFVVPLGTGPWSCRYHRMFGELLRAQLRRESPERIPELHRRAARWHATHDLPMDAIRHALAAHDWRYATGVVVAHWHDLALYGHDETPPTGSTPPPADAVRADPELALAYAADRLDLHDLGSADRYLRLADRHGHLLAEDRRGRLEVMTAAFHLAEAQRSGDAARVLSAAPHMLALADRADEEGARSIALTALGTAQLTVGEVAPAEATLSDGLAAAERAGLTCPRLVCTSALAYIRAGRGELQSAESTARTALDLPACPGQARAVHRAHAYLALALVDLHRDRLGDAGPNLDLAARSCDATAEPALAASIALARAQLRHEEGDLAGSYEALLAGRRSLGDWRPPRCLEHWFAAMEADLRTSHGETDSSREVLAPLLADPSPQVVVALARAYLRDGDSEGALKALPDWADDDALPLPLRLEAGLVEASAARLGVDGRRASKALERVLQLAEPEGFRRIFTRAGGSVRELLADHLDTGTAYWSLVSDLTAASSARPTSGNGHRAVPATTPLTDPLTDRELTVLRYLQSILSNVEIASELCLSVNTVKTHVRNIYRKLDATRRRDAVRRARELRLI
jgi:LuxR family maltose regulon positive regulatory protein